MFRSKSSEQNQSSVIRIVIDGSFKKLLKKIGWPLPILIFSLIYEVCIYLQSFIYYSDD